MKVAYARFVRHRPIPFLLIVIFLGLPFSDSDIWAEKIHSGEGVMNQPDEAILPMITVELEPVYVLEYPILVAVLLNNETTDTDYLDLPELGLLFPLDSLAVDLQPVNGDPRVRLGPSFAFRDENLFRTELMAGQAKRMLIDLSKFGQPLRPGRYELTASIFNGPGVSRSSSPVQVEFIEPSAAEHSEAERLRRLGLGAKAVDSGSWGPFLTNNWNTISLPQTVGEQAYRQLALHLCLHKAAYGPEPLARFPLDACRKLRGPVLSAEAAILEYELLVARGSEANRLAARSTIVQRWPALEFRLDKIDRGEGLLTVLRKGYGVEKDLPLPPGRLPYTLSDDE